MFTGKLEIILRDRADNIKKRLKVKNLVLNTMRNQVARLISGDQTSRYVDRMQFGSGSLEASATDEYLQQPLSPIKTITTIEHPTVYSVRFIGYLLHDEMVGFPIREAGLLCADDTLIARTTFTTVNKDSDLQAQFLWTISTV